MTIDLNADVGEATTDSAHAAELEVLDFVTSANIACGAHAGDDETMRATLRAAVSRRLAVGAHPGYPDREWMGRRSLSLEPAAIVALVAAQIRRLASLAREEGAVVSYVKAHGALYNDAARDRVIADAIAAAVVLVDPQLRLIGLSGSALIDAGREAGLETAEEGFVDRAYRDDGSLAPRTEPGAVLTELALVTVRACDLALGRAIATSNGAHRVIHADTLCLHADTPGAPALARAVRSALTNANVIVRAIGAT